VPIGTPLPHIRQVLEPAGDGQYALGISGPTLAWGYRGQPARTAECFVPGWEERTYRTGDLVQVRPDGSLAFCGRVDRQIKIRDHRVEPEQVERALVTCPGVLDAAVVAVRSGGHPALAAVYAGPVGTSPAAHLATLLPAYLCPGKLVRADRIPRNVNGKVDYTAVRRMIDEAGCAAANADDVAPGIAELVTQLLNRPCATGDDFFELGGDSLVATRLISRIYRRFDTELTLADVFERRTPEAMAHAVVARRLPGG
jgi:nonribosomal peptide synthetase protein VioO